MENRQRRTGTYDASASDSGLVIWRVDDAQYGSDSELIRPVEMMRPGAISAPGCVRTFGRAGDPITEGSAVERTASGIVVRATANSTTAAGRALRTVATGEELPIALAGTWAMTAEGLIAVGDSLVTGDAGRVKAAGAAPVGTVLGVAKTAASDGQTVEVELQMDGGRCYGLGRRRMGSQRSADAECTILRPWRDGTPSRVAVRAIGPSGDGIRAYFDVRGPGVLVDCHQAGVVPPISPGIENTLGIPVTNTSESPDTFRVSAIDLPDGWSSRRQETTLDPARGVRAGRG